MISLQDVCKSYALNSDVVPILKNISLDIKAGEYVAIVGPSGSGKSTLLHILGMLDRASSGQYHFFGKDIRACSDDELAEMRRYSIGFVFQMFNLMPRVSAWENAELSLIYQGLTKKRRKAMAMEALENVGLADYANYKPSQMSGGMQQRVAIARALVSNPDVVFADEPTGSLDSKSGQDVLEIFKRLHSMDKTIVVITHDEKVAQHADRVIGIRDGEIEYDRYTEDNTALTA
ncbi:MAG: ABC transporter ATP-binding protein [Gammaproteobacteria bacterium]|nr:ABC transporter ATP-binding protein [Gammaproteobacteria bacterium]